MNRRLPPGLKVFDGSQKTIVFNAVRHGEEGGLIFYELNRDRELIPQLMEALFNLNIQSVLVEGGARMLQSFIESGAWDEARVITNNHLRLNAGHATSNLISAPTLSYAVMDHAIDVENDTIVFLKRGERI
jgi:diaminohydroxyphosphoribosylaminopyrimidine deaminase/5-amino-6-(5-phosphoribosylamino)uracil reductase